MRRQRTIWEKVIIAIRNIITVVGVGAFILDFANDYRFTTFTIFDLSGGRLRRGRPPINQNPHYQTTKKMPYMGHLLYYRYTVG